MSHIEPIETNDHLTQRRALLAGLGGLAAGAFVAGRAKAGPLDPPAGPITSTGKTLTEVEPRIAINEVNTPGNPGANFKITQRGSYYLVGNITGQSGKSAIEIAADDVTIDLCGFALLGVQGSLDGFRNIGALFPRNHIHIHGGTVTGFGGTGINLINSTASFGCTVENMSVTSCSGDGLAIGPAATVRNSRFQFNGGNGIHCPGVGRGLVTGCLASDNQANGVLVGNSMSVSDTVAHDNAQSGITTSTNCTVSRCDARSINSSYGIRVGDYSTIADSVVNGGSIGFSLGTNSSISGCHASFNSTGIEAGNYCSITECNSHNNGRAIEAQVGCRVTRNNCSDNFGVSGGAIFVTSRCVVEDNYCDLSDVGITASGSGNIIVRNTCTACNPDFVIAANNRYGPILILPPTGTPAASSSAPSTLTTTDPWANFGY